MTKHFQLWTDGSCDNGNGIGGWAYCLVLMPENKLVGANCSGCGDTTNNRMELQGAIEGLRLFKPDDDVLIEVVSDSAYVVNCFVQGWWKKWVKSGWINSAMEEVKNRDLWETLIRLVYHMGDKVTWRHVKGHQKAHIHPWNVECDQMAGEARLVYLNKIK